MATTHVATLGIRAPLVGAWERGSDEWARWLAWQRVRASRARGRLVVILVEVRLRRLLEEPLELVVLGGRQQRLELG